MAYIGKQPTVGNFQVCDAISVVNGQAAYTMQVNSTNVEPETANHMLVSLNGVLQKPGSSFTISGSTITFASNLATGDVIDFIILLGDVLNIGAPSDDAVATASIQANAVTGAKLNTDIISAQTELAATPADTDELLISDAGTIKRIDYSYLKSLNTPVFLASKSDSNQSISHNTTTKITFNNEIVDSDSAFASSTFTVPSGEGGTYFLSAGIYVGSSQDYNYLSIRKNGSSTNVMNFTTYKNNTSDNTYHVSSLVSASAGDTFEVYYAQSKGSAVNVESNSSVGFTFFGGFKVN